VDSEAKRIYISLGEAKVKKSLLAIPKIKLQGGADSGGALKLVRTTIQNDAELSNLFTILPENAYIENQDTAGVSEGSFNFAEWAPLGVEFLLKISATVEGNQLVLRSYLYDPFRGKFIVSKRYSGLVSQGRQLAHAIMDDVLDELTGEKGIFSTKLVMVCRRNNVKQLFVMDADGSNITQITHDSNISSFPAWSRDGRFITYTAFRWYPKLGTRQDLMIFNTKTGQTRVLLSSSKINTGSTVWHPDNKSLLVSAQESGLRSIYRLNMTPQGTASGGLQRIIYSEGFDVEPDYSPDGKEVVFSSYRPGRPMIYVTNNQGQNPRRLTFAGAYNSAPVWSPRGDKIIFQGQDEVIGFFDLFMMSPNGTNLVRLTMNEKSNENPSFSPDGRHLVFASNESGRYQIYRMNVDGTGRKQITADSDECMDPAWSPRFH
jgi:TolB protein